MRVSEQTKNKLRASSQTSEALATAEKLTMQCQEALGERLIGAYLHGSLAMGGFNPERSDIDLLFVTEGKPERHALKELTRMALELHEQLPEGRHMEFTVVEKSVLQPFVYPTPFIYHYSVAHRDRYRSDVNYLCGGWEDPDLAAQVAVAYERGVTLYGLPLHELYPSVPEAAYIRSILNDVSNAESEIVENPVYVALNLCRVLLFLTDKRIASKKEGGEWGVETLPEWAEVIRPVLAFYTGERQEDVNVPEAQLKAYAKEMQLRIGAASTLNATQHLRGQSTSDLS